MGIKYTFRAECASGYNPNKLAEAPAYICFESVEMVRIVFVRPAGGIYKTNGVRSASGCVCLKVR